MISRALEIVLQSAAIAMMTGGRCSMPIHKCVRFVLFTFLASIVCTAAVPRTAFAIAPNETSSAANDAAYFRARKGKWIEVILSEQRLVAWESGRMVMTTSVSTGVRRTPTPRGTFRVLSKYTRTRMRGPGYNLPNVPYVMYFRGGGFALHGTYWHSNFGRPMSHGCVNLPTGKAAWLFNWAPRGTPVVIH
jgi:lipoprotein-anchoring transpeptidase ErfK/SrfK